MLTEFHLADFHFGEMREGDATALQQAATSTGGVFISEYATLERKTGFEPATLALARRCSTPEPLPQRTIKATTNA